DGVPGLVKPPPPPSRRILQAEALAWLDANPAEPGSSVVTSLPDVSELPGLDLEAWRAWFVGAARRILRWIPADGVAIFFQSDIRQHGVWVDKGYLVARAAEEEGAALVWHKIVCRVPPGTPTFGRASYAHMLCLSREPRPPPTHASPDVLPDGGFKPWSRAMGVEACVVACRYLLSETATRTVVDPFCGHGTALAVANALGLDAVGVAPGARKCRAARRLVVDLGDRSASERDEVPHDLRDAGESRPGAPGPEGRSERHPQAGGELLRRAELAPGGVAGELPDVERRGREVASDRDEHLERVVAPAAEDVRVPHERPPPLEERGDRPPCEEDLR